MPTTHLVAGNATQSRTTGSLMTAHSTHATVAHTVVSAVQRMTVCSIFLQSCSVATGLHLVPHVRRTRLYVSHPTSASTQQRVGPSSPAPGERLPIAVACPTRLITPAYCQAYRRKGGELAMSPLPHHLLRLALVYNSWVLTQPPVPSTPTPAHSAGALQQGHACCTPGS